MMNSRAEGGAYYRVIVNGREWSKHTTTHKAHETAYDLGVDAIRQGITPFPTIYVESAGRVYYEPDPNFAPANILPVATAIVSDGGEDIVSFLHRQFPPPADMPFVPVPPGGTHYSTLDAFLDASKAPGKWRIDARYIRLPDGTDVPFCYAWRGFGLLVHRRDKNALKISVGGSS